MVVPRAPERPGRARFDFTVAADGVQGYVWHFPTLADGRLAHTRGIYDGRVHPAQPPNLRTTLRRALEREGEPQAAARPAGHPVRWFDPQGPFSAPGMLLVGDAAGVDPLLGEGISFARAYGDVAALELRDAFAQRDFAFTGYRQRLLAHPLGRCLCRRLFVARLRYQPYPSWFQRRLYDPLGTLIHRFFARSVLDWI
jgi:flavin-dependent dehydrogenase